MSNFYSRGNSAAAVISHSQQQFHPSSISTIDSLTVESLYSNALSISSPRILSEINNPSDNTVIRTTIRRIELPYHRTVKVPNPVVQLVPTMIQQKIKIPKYITIPTTETITETYIENNSNKNSNPIRNVQQQHPLERTRTIAKPSSIIHQQYTDRIVTIPSNEPILVDAYRLDEIEESQLIEIIQQEILNKVTQQPIGKPKILELKQLGRIPNSQLARKIGCALYPPQHSELKCIELESVRIPGGEKYQSKQLQQKYPIGEENKQTEYGGDSNANENINNKNLRNNNNNNNYNTNILLNFSRDSTGVSGALQQTQISPFYSLQSSAAAATATSSLPSKSTPQILGRPASASYILPSERKFQTTNKFQQKPNTITNMNGQNYHSQSQSQSKFQSQPTLNPTVVHHTLPMFPSNPCSINTTTSAATATAAATDPIVPYNPNPMELIEISKSTIAISTVTKFINSLGIRYQTLQGAVTGSAAVENEGLLITHRARGMEQFLNGLTIGDIITCVNGKPIKTVIDFTMNALKITKAKQFWITIRRGNEKKSLWIEKPF